MPENNEGAGVAPQANSGEGASQETVSLNKSEYDELIGVKSSYGSIKRELKDLKKALEEKSNGTPQKTSTDDSGKYESLLLEVKGIKSDSERELVNKLKKETNLPVESLLSSRYFQIELETLRTEEANALATSGVKGDQAGGGNAKQSAQYWIAKGEYPSRDQVPDRAVRAEVRKALAAKVNGSATGNFYNS